MLFKLHLLIGTEDRVEVEEVEEFYKSLKSKAGLAKSPIRRVSTENNSALWQSMTYSSWGCLKIKHKTNHFALLAKLFINTNMMAYLGVAKN